MLFRSKTNRVQLLGAIRLAYVQTDGPARRGSLEMQVGNQRRSDTGVSTLGQQGDVGDANLLLHPHHHHSAHRPAVDQHDAVVGIRISGLEVGLLRVELQRQKGVPLRRVPAQDASSSLRLEL